MRSALRREVFNLPNYLTMARIAAIPAVVWLLVQDSPLTNLAAVTLFLAAALTDMLDGYLARRMGLDSALGKLLDPLADKILVSTVMIALVPLGRLDAWIPMVELLCQHGRMRSKLRPRDRAQRSHDDPTYAWGVSAEATDHGSGMRADRWGLESAERLHCCATHIPLGAVELGDHNRCQMLLEASNLARLLSLVTPGDCSFVLVLRLRPCQRVKVLAEDACK